MKTIPWLVTNLRGQHTQFHSHPGVTISIMYELNGGGEPFNSCVDYTWLRQWGDAIRGRVDWWSHVNTLTYFEEWRKMHPPPYGNG